MSKEIALEIIEKMKLQINKYLANTDKILNRKRKNQFDDDTEIVPCFFENNFKFSDKII